MITVSDLSLNYSGTPLFSHVDLQFLRGNCYGIIGANGAGKSTFLKILSGDLEPSTGEVSILPNTRMSVLKQNQNAYDAYNVMDTVIMGNQRLYDIGKEKEALYAKEEMTDEDGMRACQLEEEYAELGGWESESDASRILQGLGIGTDLHDNDMATLDARLKVKVLLAQALFGNTMYRGFKFEPSAKFTDDLKNKPLMQQLWAGDKLTADEKQINQSSEGLALFLGCNSFVDYEMGRVLDVIKEKMPNAMVIYTSDHGDMLGAHRLFSKNAAIYDEVTNIPLIIKGGEKGKVITTPASHIDIAPTVMDYFGLHIPKLLEGKSMLPQIYDTTIKINSEVYTEFTRYEIDHDGFGGLQIMRGVISENYKLAINLLDKDEFYDLKKDPDEMVNEIDNPEYLEIILEYHRKLVTHMNATRDLYRGYQWSLRPWNKNFTPSWDNEGFTRQRENEEYEPRQLDYDTGLPIKEAVRSKYLYEMGGEQ